MAIERIDPHQPTTPARPTWWRPAARAFTALLGLNFVFSGGMKLVAPGLMAATFAGWGYPPWFLYAVGTLEVLAGILLLVPATAALGGLLVAGTMAGAVLTHAAAGEWGTVAVPVLLGLAAATVAWRDAPARVRTAILAYIPADAEPIPADE